MSIKKFEKIALSVSNKGVPCLWENGGKKEENFGQSFIIADKYGKPKKPLYIRAQPKPNSGHALIPVRTQDVIVVCKIKNDVETIQIYTITQIDLEGKVAVVNVLNSFEEGEWTTSLDNRFDKVVEAAKRKASTKDCIEVGYAVEMNKKSL